MVFKSTLVGLLLAITLSFSANAEGQLSEAEKASAIYEEFFEVSLRMNPVEATFLGDTRYNDQLPN
jgi:hypothetical protein